MQKGKVNGTLKLASAIFYQTFIFSPNDSPSKTVKNVLYFFVFPSTFSRFKRTNGSGIIKDVMHWLA